ncbi:endoplasmic reticulum-Golgi intermediate compartment protein 3 [Bacillus rossius redtenbacheri]|uniref:endoplasmic reticulum-Golgi intermediate compartment protein 3 n=1 Tax=Bacillus rossius redtenbacheri TaxID=93214 RepID=UPI002FDD59BD
MMATEILDTLRNFDAYPKTLEDFRIKTFGGAAVTIISGMIMAALFLSELRDYLNPSVTEELFVDTSRGSKLKINFDIITPHISCDYLAIDAMDTSGEQHLQIDHNVFKRKLDLDLKPIEVPKKEDVGGVATTVTEQAVDTTPSTTEACGSCYGAETAQIKCCNTCEAVKEAYRRKKWAISDLSNIKQCSDDSSSEKMSKAFKEACQIYGTMEVNRVGGSFHIAPGQSFSINHVHVHDVQPFSSSSFNTSHHIRHLSFGRNIAGVTDPMDGTESIASEGATMFQYYIKIVPTTYVRRDGAILQTNQFSVTMHQKAVSILTGESGMPGIFFSYELAPVMVKISEKEKSLGHLATNVCAIIGGVFTVASLIDAFIYRSVKAIQKKIELGKVN